MGEESCYSLAFGVPAILMFVALGILYTSIIQRDKEKKIFFLVSFFVGSRSYKKVIPERNIVTLFFKVSWVGSVLIKGQHMQCQVSARSHQEEIQDKEPTLAGHCPGQI